METTETTMTVHAQNVDPEEIALLQNTLFDMEWRGDIPEDSPLVLAIRFILDTLEAGKGVTIFTRLPPEAYARL